MTKFYLPCPECGLPIRGRSFGQEIEQHHVDFEAEVVDSRQLRDPYRTITIDPTAPSRYEAQRMGTFGASSTITLAQLAGDDASVERLFLTLGRGQHAVEEMWPYARDLFEYSLAKDWTGLQRIGQSIYKEQWDGRVTAFGRGPASYAAVGATTAEVRADTNMGIQVMLDRFGRKHEAAIRDRSGTYVALLSAAAERKNEAELQRRFFDAIANFMASFESWRMGVLWWALPNDRRRILGHVPESGVISGF